MLSEAQIFIILGLALLRWLTSFSTVLPEQFPIRTDFQMTTHQDFAPLGKHGF